MSANHRCKEFQTIKKLTHGGDNGTQNAGIYLSKHLATNKVYIEKRIVTSGYARREIQAMLLCQSHPHLVHIFKYHVSGPYASIYMQHCELGSLDALILRYNARSTRLQDEGFLWRVFWDLALAVCFLATGQDYAGTRQRAIQGRSVQQSPSWIPFLHRDIKPGNVFMTWTNPMAADALTVYPSIVLGDFGCVVSPTDLYSRHKDLLGQGDPRFEPPEETFCAQSDVFGICVVLHCLARMTHVPSDAIHSELVLGRQYTGSLQLVQLARHCLAARPENRPAPQHLPRMVFEGFRVWRQCRRNDGAALPAWAFGLNAKIQ